MNDDEASTTLVDASDNALDATLVDGVNSSALSVDGKIGGAINFGGTNHATVPSDWSTAMSGAAGCSFACWFQLSSLSVGYFIYLTINGNYGKLLVDYNVVAPGNRFRIGARAYNGDAFQFVVTDDAFTDTASWHHMAAVIDVAGNHISFYIDGVLQSVSGSISFGQSTFSGDFGNPSMLAANYTGAQEFPGIMDDVRFYGEILSPLKIKRLYNRGCGTERKNLWPSIHAHYKMNGRPTDASGWGNHATRLGGYTDYGAGVRGNAIDLSGDFDRLDVSSHSFRFSPDTSISFWCNLDQPIGSGSHRYWPGIWSAGTNGSYDDYITFAHYDSGEAVIVRDLAGYHLLGYFSYIPGTWMHVVVSKDITGRMWLYINGGIIDSTASSANNSLAYFGIGYGGASKNGAIDGLVDDLRIYGRFLPLEEIQAIFNNGTEELEPRQTLIKRPVSRLVRPLVGVH